MKISIIVPVYNVEPYIKECLHSIMNQTFNDLEVIIVDDCGVDKSMEIVENEIAIYSGPIRFKILRHQKNRGLSAARNTGISVAQGNYISFIDSDDYISPILFEKLHTTINQSLKYAIVSCMPIEFDESGEYGIPDRWQFSNNRVIESSDYLERMVFQQSCHTAWGKLFRIDLFRDVYFREGRNNEDTLLALELAPYIEKNDLQIVELPDGLYYYRQRQNSITNSSNLKTPLYFDEIVNLSEVVTYTKNNNIQLWNKVVVKFLWELFGIYIKIRDDAKLQKYYFKYVKLFKLVPNDVAQKEFVKYIEDYQLFLIYKYLPFLMWIKWQLKKIIKLINNNSNED